MNKQIRFDRIFYPSDFSPESEVAFQHALKIALKSKAFLQMMHVDTNNRANWEDFPGVRETLARWQIIPTGSAHGVVRQHGLEVCKVIASSNDPVQACLDYFEVHDVDLIVLSIHQRDGIMRWMGNIVGERIFSGSRQATLFIPAGLAGFVSKDDGSVKLENIVVPIVNKPRPEASLEFVERLISNLNLDSGNVTLLHVGSSETMPEIQYPTITGWNWNVLRIEGERISTIVNHAKSVNADLIVMTTDGPDRFLDGIRGTTSERVLRKAHCPVAVIPVAIE